MRIVLSGDHLPEVQVPVQRSFISLLLINLIFVAASVWWAMFIRLHELPVLKASLADLIFLAQNHQEIDWLAALFLNRMIWFLFGFVILLGIKLRCQVTHRRP
jgi:hypothetical protein